MKNTETRPSITDHPSLGESHGTIAIPKGVGLIRRFLAFAGPGYLVSVGYMDPGNWGTDLAGGAKFGYSLIWVILMSNLMAIFLQIQCSRFGIVMEKDLAQACRDYYKKPISISLWILCEIAIVACDLAEVIGSAVALNLLFGVPVVWGVLITGLDVMALLGLMHFGFRNIEAIVMVLVATIALSFGFEVILSKPDWAGVLAGTFIPTLPNHEALFISIGILGATVMPHNLYLHTSIVQTRSHGRDPASMKQSLKMNAWDTFIALMFAFFVNAAILVVSASVFNRAGHYDVAELQDAQRLLVPLLGGAASTVFAVALMASGQSSTITGTLAGQIVMEGFLRIHIAPWLRRIITRGLAIIPAVLLIGSSGGKNTVQLLILSQVVLSLQLPFAIFPLMHFTSDPKKMGVYANPLWLKIMGYIVCYVILALNIYLLYQIIGLRWLVPLFAGLIAFWVWTRYLYHDPSRIEA